MSNIFKEVTPYTSGTNILKHSICPYTIDNKCNNECIYLTNVNGKQICIKSEAITINVIKKLLNLYKNDDIIPDEPDFNAENNIQNTAKPVEKLPLLGK